MLKKASLSLLSLLIISCANQKSFVKKNEFVSIEISENPKGVAAAGAPVLPVLVPIVSKWVFTKAKGVLAKKSKDYVASYSARYNSFESGQKGFYKVDVANNDSYNSTTKKIIKKENTINGNQETVIEEIPLGSKSKYKYTTKLNSRAMSIYRKSDNNLLSEIELEFVPIQYQGDNAMFFLRPSLINITKAKTKLRKGDNNLDLIVAVKIYGYYKKNGEISKKLCGDIGFNIKNIELNQEYKRTELSKPSKKASLNYVQRKFLEAKTDIFFPIPLDSGITKSDHYGNYSIEVTVTEMDDFGKRIKQIGEDIGNASGAISKDLINTF